MIGKDVELIEYSKRVDFWNCLTHIVGAVFGFVALIMLVARAEGARYMLSAIIYGVALIAVYTMSSVYHGLPNGERKRKARLADHCTVPILIAGTATPCALLTLYEINSMIGISVLVLAWLCTSFGIFSKLFFFEKLKAVTMAVYIGSGALMLTSVIPVFDSINTVAFGEILAGCACYLIGAVLCGLGRKTPCLHAVFHVFVLLGSMFHFYSIYMYMF
ncbi:MAG: hemolysin III family protein [Clostridia bacterium]|nr:hemolysin III family protein [Clostridia bacterium]